MGFIVVTEEPSSREVGDVIIVGSSPPYFDLEELGSDVAQVDMSDVSEIWNRESPELEEEIAEDQDDESADDEEDDDEDDDDEEDDEEEDDEADAEAEDDDTDSERA
jgi:hypothetical protein